MKFLLSWIFDHIYGSAAINVTDLVNAFNRTTAEIEQVEHITFEAENFTIVKIAKINADSVEGYSAEFNQYIDLSKRTDVILGAFFLVIKDNDLWRWATLTDFQSSKDGLVPIISCASELNAGGWKKLIPHREIIIEVDNKSITNRPDLWGHRGMAREIAALLNLTLKPLDKLVVPIPLISAENYMPANKNCPFVLSIESGNVCKKFSSLYCPMVENRASDLLIAYRLMRVDSRPINAIVDLTNYVMFDIGQPMHAFDANLLHGDDLTVRLAHEKEKLFLLDGETIELTHQDAVIADQSGPISLIGIMGGKTTGVTINTHSLLIQSDCLDAGTIRHTAARFKKRTESSARFEKSLDPAQTSLALQRFIALAHELKLPINYNSAIITLGKPIAKTIIILEHDFIQKRLGIDLDSHFIINTLEKLEFQVVMMEKNHKIEYTITVPSFRATKDITSNEDIIEEIARFYGYDAIKGRLPMQELNPWNNTGLMRMRAIKRQCAYVMNMQEVYNYALFDEQFLQQLGWQPQHTVKVQSPVSNNWQTLITTLFPGLLKNCVQNSSYVDCLNFFELGRTWQMQEDILQEKKVLAGIMMNQKAAIDFYNAKQSMQILFDSLGFIIEWIKIDETSEPWFAIYESAYLMHNSLCIGRAGKINKALFNRILPGDAFIFELDADFLMNFQLPLKKYEPMSKYPDVHRDVSMLIPGNVAAQHLITVIKTADSHIMNVTLIDHFTKDEWQNQKALTMHLTIRDYEKTLTKEEIDQIMGRVIILLKREGAVIR